MDGAKEVTTALSSSISLAEKDGAPKVDPTSYRKCVDTLQYLNNFYSFKLILCKLRSSKMIFGASLKLHRRLATMSEVSLQNP